MSGINRDTSLTMSVVEDTCAISVAKLMSLCNVNGCLVARLSDVEVANTFLLLLGTFSSLYMADSDVT